MIEIFSRGLELRNRCWRVGIPDHQAHQLLSLIPRKAFTADVVSIYSRPRRPRMAMANTAVEQDQPLDVLWMRRGVKVSEEHAPAKTRYENSLASGDCHHESRCRRNIGLEHLVGPVLELD